MAELNIKDRALVRMLALLSRKQMKAFQEYMACGMFNKSQTLVKLLHYLAKVAGKPGKLSLEKLHKDTGIGATVTDKLFSQLLHHLNRFIAQWENQDNVRADYAATLNGWLRLGLAPELLEREYQKMKRKFGDTPGSDQELYHALQLEHNYAQFKIAQPRKGNLEPFEPHLRLLESYYLVTKLKYLCAGVNAGRVYYGLGGAPETPPEPEQVAPLPPLGKAYYQAYQLLGDAETDIVEAERLLEMLDATGAQFAFEDRMDLYGYLINSCLRRITAGDAAFLALTNRVYDQMLAHDIFTEGGQGHIPASHFKNIASTKMRLGAIEETREFVMAYQHLLAENERDVLVTHILGLVSFHSGDYQDAIARFREVIRDSPSDLFWNLEARNMLWKSYFEAYYELSPDEHEEMMRLSHSFRLYVARNSRISDYHKTAYENFIRLFNRLIILVDRSFETSTTAELESLQEEASGMAHIVHKKWFVEAVARKIQGQKKKK